MLQESRYLDLSELPRKQRLFVEAHPHSKVTEGAFSGTICVYQYFPDGLIRFIVDAKGKVMEEKRFDAGEADRQTYASFTDESTQALDEIWELPTYDGPRPSSS